jgi:ribulose bisphosphate carboxylase small subunit
MDSNPHPSAVSIKRNGKSTATFYRGTKNVSKNDTQLQTILDHLKKKKSAGITSWDAISTYGITRLAHYIHLLRSRGYGINDEYEHDIQDRTHKWKRYWLTSSPKAVAKKK